MTTKTQRIEVSLDELRYLRKRLEFAENCLDKLINSSLESSHAWKALGRLYFPKQMGDLVALEDALTEWEIYAHGSKSIGNGLLASIPRE